MSAGSPPIHTSVLQIEKLSKQCLSCVFCANLLLNMRRFFVKFASTGGSCAYPGGGSFIPGSAVWRHLLVRSAPQRLIIHGESAGTTSVPLQTSAAQRLIIRSPRRDALVASAVTRGDNPSRLIKIRLTIHSASSGMTGMPLRLGTRSVPFRFPIPNPRFEGTRLSGLVYSSPVNIKLRPANALTGKDMARDIRQ